MPTIDFRPDGTIKLTFDQEPPLEVELKRPTVGQLFFLQYEVRERVESAFTAAADAIRADESLDDDTRNRRLLELEGSDLIDWWSIVANGDGENFRGLARAHADLPPKLDWPLDFIDPLALTEAVLCWRRPLVRSDQMATIRERMKQNVLSAEPSSMNEQSSTEPAPA